MGLGSWVNPKKLLKKTTKVLKNSTKDVFKSFTSGLKGDFKDSFGYFISSVANTLTLDHVRDKQERAKREVEQINKAREENARSMAARETGQATSDFKSSNPYEADTTDLLNAKDNPSRLSTLLTGNLGIDPSKLHLGKGAHLGGGR